MSTVSTHTNAPASDPAIADLAHILMPADLRNWIDPHALANLVITAQETAATGIESPAEPSPRSLMFTLTYSYAAGMLASDSIAEAVPGNAVLQELCPEGFLAAADLRRFRRTWRLQIQACLAKVLELAWNLRHQHAAEVRFGWELKPGADAAFLQLANHPLTLARAFALEAARRLSYAIQLDSMALDS
jgi:hypothetical protein